MKSAASRLYIAYFTPGKRGGLIARLLSGKVVLPSRRHNVREGAYLGTLIEKERYCIFIPLGSSFSSFKRVTRTRYACGCEETYEQEDECPLSPGECREVEGEVEVDGDTLVIKTTEERNMPCRKCRARAIMSREDYKRTKEQLLQESNELKRALMAQEFLERLDRELGSLPAEVWDDLQEAVPEELRYATIDELRSRIRQQEVDPKEVEKMIQYAKQTAEQIKQRFIGLLEQGDKVDKLQRCLNTEDYKSVKQAYEDLPEITEYVVATPTPVDILAALILTSEQKRQACLVAAEKLTGARYTYSNGSLFVYDPETGDNYSGRPRGIYRTTLNKRALAKRKLEELLGSILKFADNKEWQVSIPGKIFKITREREIQGSIGTDRLTITSEESDIKDYSVQGEEKETRKQKLLMAAVIMDLLGETNYKYEKKWEIVSSGDAHETWYEDKYGGLNYPGWWDD